MEDLHNIENRKVFHSQRGLFVERLNDGSVRVFRAGTGTSMYYTPENGFHHKETELAVFDKDTWHSITKFIEGVATHPDADGGAE